ncbi:MAG: HEAT repeat domain-containing protein [Planctomycetota bacterium]
MNRVFLLLTTVLLAAAPALSAPADRAAIRKAFKGPDTPVEDRLAAAKSLALMDGKFAATQACIALEQTLANIDGLALRRSDARDRLAEIVDLANRDAKEIKSLRQREVDLRARDVEQRAVARMLRRALRAFRDPGALKHMATGVMLRKNSAVGVRAACAEALGVIGDPSSRPHLVKAMDSRDPDLRTAALKALTLLRREAERDWASLAKPLSDEQWTVRLAAARQLAFSATVTAVDLLIQRLPHETGRLREDFALLLRSMTGQKFGVEVEGWRHWWSENRESYTTGEKALEAGSTDADAGAGDTGAVTYYGITTYSQRILYIIDVSGSMNEAGRNPDLMLVDEAKAELKRSLKMLGSGASFTVFAFDDAVRKWKPRLVEAKKGAKNDAITWVDRLLGSSWTNAYAALEEGIRISAAGDIESDYGGAADTIFFLSDGAPTTPEGKLTDHKGDPEAVRVLKAVSQWNSEKRVVIHTIGIGPSPDTRFLGRLARDNGGRYVRVK